MEKILGLDLGTNSIGWAIRDVNPSLENQLVDFGVLTFDKGVAEDKSGEHPLVQKRTQSRGKRRNYQAEKYRKWALLELLIENGMCPLSLQELDEWRYYRKDVGRKYPQSEKFIQWLRFDFDGDGKPDFERFGFSKHESHYLFRALIIDKNSIEIFKQNPHLVGRVFYQLVQRRGYNDNEDIEEKDQTELSKTIMQGGGDSGANGVNSILPYLKKYKTLGAALYFLQKEEKCRIRKRYNLRSHFKQEISAICDTQHLKHLSDRLMSAIIWQRPLRSQKGLVGVCTFEKNKRRCPISHPLYEEYKTWVFINNLKINPLFENGSYLNKIPLEKLLNDVVYPLFYKASPEFKLSSIKKEVAKFGFEISGKFPDDTKVNSVAFLYKIKNIFGDDWCEKVRWQVIQQPGYIKSSGYDIEDLWHIHFAKTTNKKTNEDPKSFIVRFAIEKLGLTHEKATEFASIRLKKGYATLSANAIKKILPYLKKGFLYSEAVYMANLPKVMGRPIAENDIENYAEIIKHALKQHRYEEKKNAIINSLIAQYFDNSKRFIAEKKERVEQQISEVYGAETWKSFSVQKISNIEQDIFNEINSFIAGPKLKPEEHFKKPGRLHDKIFGQLMDEYGLPYENIKHLWHPSEQEIYPAAQEKHGKYFLGSPEPISKGFKNPMALKTMHKLKQLINHLIKENKIDKETRIVIEIARELNDANKRKAIAKWQREREKENTAYSKMIEEINKECHTTFDSNDKNIIDKIRLWEEQNRFCMYTGKAIGLCDILNGSKYDYEHTIPASMSFDNEQKNLTIADKKYNQQIKGKRLPYECPNYLMEFTIDGISYPPIVQNIQQLFGNLIEVEKKIKGKIVKELNYEKIINLEKNLAEWKSKTSDEKEIKDSIIQRRHYIKMDLDYWRTKLKYFTTEEFKTGWRNSQLRDTQTITKYALPYLKTVFSRVEVQKGSITADFRKIYKLQPITEKKERTEHSHHAIDAAVLTLIPPAAIRDKILKSFNEEQDLTGKIYHEHPKDWLSFKPNDILKIKDNILINYLPQNRTLTQTEKNIRKRGRIQYVKFKNTDGKWQYRLDKNVKKIPLIAKGDTIRGSLHKESYFGAIKNKGELILVERYPVSTFSSINDCKNIIDDAVRAIVQNELQRRIDSGLPFDKAKLDPIPFPNGKAIIKKVRCKVAAGRGYLTPEKAIPVQKHHFLSKHTYKQHLYAQNDGNAFCLYYENEIDGKKERAFRIISLFELAQLKLKNKKELFNETAYNTLEKKKGKTNYKLPLHTILTIGQKVIFFNQHPDEIKSLPKEEMLKRVFRIYKFNEMGTPNLYLQNHLEARKNELLDDGYTAFDSTIWQYRLKIKADKFTCLLEENDFLINPDGNIKWL